MAGRGGSGATGHCSLAGQLVPSHGAVRRSPTNWWASAWRAEAERTRAQSAAHDAHAEAWKTLSQSEFAQRSGVTGHGLGAMENLTQPVAAARQALPDQAQRLNRRDLQLLAAANGTAQQYTSEAAE
ncbi:hypothetical protein [Streptomyces sp. NBC_00690]|uniref:hypothetical protein n=1 Tax=Streptomyces sp. NBC_00690 TaxID=2975808 RepID=UPI002E29ACCB|nr:hypothetical protein [Streptomyces sp. NBC_00690]